MRFGRDPCIPRTAARAGKQVLGLLLPEMMSERAKSLDGHEIRTGTPAQGRGSTWRGREVCGSRGYQYPSCVRMNGSFGRGLPGRRERAKRRNRPIRGLGQPHGDPMPTPGGRYRSLLTYWSTYTTGSDMGDMGVQKGSRLGVKRLKRLKVYLSSIEYRHQNCANVHPAELHVVVERCPCRVSRDRRRDSGERPETCFGNWHKTHTHITHK